MPHQGKAFGGRDQVPGHGRQGALALGGGRAQAACRRPQQASAQGGDVAIHHHGSGGEGFAGRQADPADPPVVGEDLRDLGAEAEAGAPRHGQSRQGGGDLVHAAVDRPDPLLLHMGDEHEGGRGEEGRGPAIGGIAAKELPQAGIREVLAQGLPQGLEGADLEQALESEGPDPPHQAHWRRARGADEGLLQGLIDATGLAAEVAVAPGRGGAGKVADGGDGPLQIGKKIQTTALVPGVTGQDLQGADAQFGLQVGPDLSQQLVEDPAHGEDRRPGVDALAGHRHLAQFAPRLIATFADQHLDPTVGEEQGGHQAGHAGANDDHGGRGHGAPLGFDHCDCI